MSEHVERPDIEELADTVERIGSYERLFRSSKTVADKALYAEISRDYAADVVAVMPALIAYVRHLEADNAALKSSLSRRRDECKRLRQRVGELKAANRYD